MPSLATLGSNDSDSDDMGKVSLAAGQRSATNIHIVNILFTTVQWCTVEFLLVFNPTNAVTDIPSKIVPCLPNLNLSVIYAIKKLFLRQA